jgi:hypothetical protein
VEHRGNAPRATCLQGMSAPLCVSQTIFKSGARSWFRANLSAVSARRCHQISFPSWASCWSRGRDLNPRARFCGPADRHSRHRDDGADGGNRTRVFGVALRGWTFQLHPHGGKRRESNLLPQRDCVYGAATAPAVLTGASQSLPQSGENWRRAEGSNLCPCGPLGFRDRLPATPAALSEQTLSPAFALRATTRQPSRPRWLAEP